MVSLSESWPQTHSPSGQLSEALLLLLRAIPGFALIVHPSGEIVAANSRLGQLLGDRVQPGTKLWIACAPKPLRPQFRLWFQDRRNGTGPDSWDTSLGVSPPNDAIVRWTLSLLDAHGAESPLFLCVGEDRTELRDLREELQRSERKFNAFMDGMPGIAFIKDRSRRLQYVSKMFETVFECSAEQGLGRRDEDFLPRPVAKRIKKIETRILRDGGTDLSIEEDEAVAGGKRWMIHRFGVGEGPDRILGGISLDITSLSDAEDRFRASAEASPDAVAILRPIRDERGRVSDFLWDFLNAPGETLFQRLDNLPFMQSVAHSFSPAALDRLLPEFIRVFETGTPLETTLRDSVEAQPERTLVWRVVRAGDFLALDIRDTSEDVRAQQEREDASNRFRQLFDWNPAACMTLDREGCVVEWNARCEEVYGYSKDEVQGRSIIDLVVSPVTRETAKKAHADTSSGGGYHFGSEWQVYRKDGTPIWVHTSSVPLLDPAGNLIGTISSNIDITARKSAESQLKASNADLEQFAYAASHDLLEPVRMVCSFLELLETECGSNLNEDGRLYLRYAKEGGMRMRNLIRHLLEFSKLGRGNRTCQRVAMDEVCDEVASNLRVALQDANAIFEFAGLPTVYGCRVDLVRLVQNLVANSLKFRSQAPCRVVLACQSSEEGLLFTCADNGIGIDPRFVERVFQIFQRLHHAESYEGCGIGLALCRKIAELHGGRIWADTAAETGARIHFTLPAAS